MMSYLTFYGEGISDDMWQLFPMLYKAFDGWAVDWMDSMWLVYYRFLFVLSLLIPLVSFVGSLCHFTPTFPPCTLRHLDST